MSTIIHTSEAKWKALLMQKKPMCNFNWLYYYFLWTNYIYSKFLLLHKVIYKKGHINAHCTFLLLLLEIKNITLVRLSASLTEYGIENVIKLKVLMSLIFSLFCWVVAIQWKSAMKVVKVWHFLMHVWPQYCNISFFYF